MKHLSSTLALCMLFPAAAFAQSSIDANMRAAADAITAAAAEAAAAEISDAEVQETAYIDRLTVENSMSQIDNSADHDLGNHLPLPQFPGYDDLLVALDYRSAWRGRDRSNEADEEYRDALAALPHFGGVLYYREWACETGGEIAIARQAAELFQRLVTPYPERLMLSAFLAERELLGYPASKNCDYDALGQSRRLYQERLAVVVK